LGILLVAMMAAQRVLHDVANRPARRLQTGRAPSALPGFRNPASRTLDALSLTRARA